MADYPDIYADGFQLSAGPFGVTITLTVTQPSGEPGPHQDPTDTVARVRLSRELAQKLAETLPHSLAATMLTPQQGPSVKH